MWMLTQIGLFIVFGLPVLIVIIVVVVFIVAFLILSLEEIWKSFTGE